MGDYSDIVVDIARKCDEDVNAAIERNMGLVSGARAMAQVAYMGAASALGTAGGAFLAIHEATGAAATDEDVADGMLAMLKPMLVRSISKMRAAKGATHDPR